MKRGAQTKLKILDTGIDMAGSHGLEGVTIGTLAKAVGMSKSGLYAHFSSKEDLQIEILKRAGEIFSENVIIPALKTKAGIPRINALVDNWVAWGEKIKGGCIFVKSSADFNAREGRIKDFLRFQQLEWIDCLSRIGNSAVRVEDFRSDIDCRQFAFDLYSLLLGFHLYDTMLDTDETKIRKENALLRLLDYYRK